MSEDFLADVRPFNQPQMDLSANHFTSALENPYTPAPYEATLKPPDESEILRPPEPTAFLDKVGSKITEGFLGYPVPRILVSAGIGAAIGAAAAPGVGAIPGAIFGGLAAALGDLAGAAGSVAVADALKPYGGLETPFGTISPQLAAGLTDLGIGVVGGGALIKGAGKAAKGLLKGWQVSQAEAKLGAKLESVIPEGVKQLDLPSLMPADPYLFIHYPPEMKNALRALENFGVPIQKGTAWDSAVDLTNPEHKKVIEDLWNRIMTPAGGLKTPGVGSIGKVLPIGEAAAAFDKTTEFLKYRLFRWIASPWHMALGDRSSEEIVRAMSGGEMISRPIRNHYFSAYKDAVAGLDGKSRNLLKEVWLHSQGATEAETSKKALEGAAEVLASPQISLPFTSEAPPIRNINFAEGKQLAENQLKALNRPDLLPVYNKVSEMYEQMGEVLVKMGKLKPEELVHNYLPFIRESRVAEQATLRELPSGYRPTYIENQVPKEARAFMLNRRRLDIPPKDMGLDDIFRIYASSFSRLVGNETVFNKVKDLLPQVVGQDRAAYMASVVNNFIGKPGSSSSDIVRETANVMKNVEFWRLIGGSVLTPLVNSTQRLNVLGYTSWKNWLRGMLPNKQYVERANELGLLGEDIKYADLIALDGSYGAFRKGIKKITDVAGWPFFQSEQGNIAHAFKSGVFEALERGAQKGIPAEQMMPYAEEYGKMVADRTQFVSRVGRTAPWMAEHAGAQVLGQFKTFMVNQVGLLESMTRTNPVGAGRLAMGMGLLFGPDAIFPGLELEAKRKLLGKPFKMPGGLSEGLVGAAGTSMAQYVSIFGVQPDDIRRLYTSGLGPSFDHIKGIAEAITGVNLGEGLKLDKFGMPLTPDEWMMKLTRSVPLAGQQLERVRKFAKLYSANWDDRKALNTLESLGIETPRGPLQQDLSRSEAAARAFGLVPTRLYEQDQFMEMMSGVEQEYKVMLGRTAELMFRGRQQDAQKLVRNFRTKYPEVAYFVPGPESLKAAGQRMAFDETWRALQNAPKPVKMAYFQELMNRQKP